MKLKALIINCTLKYKGKTSNTQALLDKAIKLLQAEKIETEVIRFTDFKIAHGTSSDEGNGDEWPQILQKIKACDILIIGSPIWLGHLASTTQQLLERLDAVFHEEELMNPENGQYYTYNKVAGVVCTGNEDGAHAVTGHVLWAMQELGFTVPPNANSYWVGEAGPGPSFIEAGGLKKLYPNKTIRMMTANLIYFARLLKENPIPSNLKKIGEEAEKESTEEQK